VTTANIPDNRMYVSFTSPSSSSVFSLPSALYMVADQDYDDKNLYEYSKKVLGIDLVCPVERYENNMARIKSVFRINPLPACGFYTVSAIVLLSVLLYQIMVYYNCKSDKINPKSIKYTLGTG